MNKPINDDRYITMILRLTAFALILLVVAGCNFQQLNRFHEEDSNPPIADITQEAARSISYWRYFWLESGLPEDDMIEVFPMVYLERVESDLVANADAAENIQIALQIIIDTPEDRIWETETMTIDDVRVEGSAATIVLNGDIMVFGGGVALGTEMQFALTVFEEPGIETALITLNGQNIANLVVDHPSQSQPDDFVYRRETFAEYLSSP
jgi:hypothetical protein